MTIGRRPARQGTGNPANAAGTAAGRGAAGHLRAPHDPDAVTRQPELMRLRDVQAVNLQFRAGSTTSLADIETLPVLTQDSLVIAGPGRRSKPITRELFDVLARLASTGRPA